MSAVLTAHGDRTAEAPSETGAEPTPVVYSVWWALWLSPYLVFPLMLLVLFNATTAEGALSGMFAMMALMIAGQGCAGFAARSVVRSLSWRALLLHAAVQESG